LFLVGKVVEFSVKTSTSASAQQALNQSINQSSVGVALWQGRLDKPLYW
jgi:hypothetical protein